MKSSRHNDITNEFSSYTMYVYCSHTMYHNEECLPGLTSYSDQSWSGKGKLLISNQNLDHVRTYIYIHTTPRKKQSVGEGQARVVGILDQNLNGDVKTYLMDQGKMASCIFMMIVY